MILFILCLCFTSSLCGNYKENKVCDQPCNDDNSVPSPSKSAHEIVRYSQWILEQLDSYKDEFILKLERHDANFQEFIQFAEQRNEQWLRKFYWFIDEILPRNKYLGLPTPNTTIEDLKVTLIFTTNWMHMVPIGPNWLQIKISRKMAERLLPCSGAEWAKKKSTKIKIRFKPIVMTKINAGLKFITATFDQITKLPDNVEIMKNDLDFKRTMRESIRIIRSIMCSMENYMKSHDIGIEVLLDDFLDKHLTNNEMGLMLQDTFNYFEYIKQLFETLHVSETEVSPEARLWGNPCEYSPPPRYYFNKSSDENDWHPDPYKATELASLIAIQANRTFNDGMRFKDDYAKILGYYPTFDEELEDKDDEEWLKKASWYQDEVLPASKKLFSKLPNEYLTKHLMKVFPKVLPLIHKGAKKILSGIDRVLMLPRMNKKKNALNFKPVLEAYMLEIQNLLCLFSDYVKASGQEQLWLYEETKISSRWAFAIFRDSLNYLEYISEVFEYIAKNQSVGIDPFAPE